MGLESINNLKGGNWGSWAACSSPFIYKTATYVGIPKPRIENPYQVQPSQVELEGEGKREEREKGLAGKQEEREGDVMKGKTRG